MNQMTMAISQQMVNELNMIATKTYRNVLQMNQHSIDPASVASTAVVKEILSYLGIPVTQQGVEIPSEQAHTVEDAQEVENEPTAQPEAIEEDPAE